MTRESLDLRLAPAALGVWAAAALGAGWSAGHALAGAALLVVLAGAITCAGVVLRRRRPSRRRRRAATVGLWAAVVASAAAFAVTSLRTASIRAGPVDDLARENAFVSAEIVVTGDPVVRTGTFAPYTLVPSRIEDVTVRGSSTDVRTPVLVIGSQDWSRAALGQRLAVSGRLREAATTDVAAALLATTAPRLLEDAPSVQQAVGAVRAGLAEAASPLPDAEQALVPALVDGDDASMPDDVRADFQITGLTHLLAVSGANLTLVLGFVLVIARWIGVRGRWATVVGLAAVVFFVLLARPQPSVLRAAAMGVVALVGLSAGGPRRGIRALCVAVVGLLLLEPALARSIGFLLSTTATAGILLLAPLWRDRLARWLPLSLAEAVAVPLAAQLACTPAIAAISAQVSLVAVVANLLAGPAVAPATVIGLIAGLVALLSDHAAHLLGRVAGVPAWWIVTVARHGAAASGASISWAVGPVALVVLATLCLALVLSLPRLLASPVASVSTCLLLVLVVVQPWGRLGWPPPGWLMVMCDVGQGDGMVLNAGGDVAVVVDTGPDPRAMDRCLDDLDVRRIALVVLTHFHADHVNGLPAVLDGRQVAEIEVTSLRDPPDRADAVDGWAAAHEVPVHVVVPGEKRQAGDLTWSVLGPVRTPAADGSELEGSGPNNASIVMLVEVHGHRLLLSGDAEPEEEADILAERTDLDVDVFKVAHHGSANQDPEFVLDTGASLALVSVGADNDYGHPAPETLALLRRLGAVTYRTDRDGDVAVVDRGGQLAVIPSH